MKPRRPSTVSLKSIAARAGVSESTAAKVLKDRLGQTRVRPATVEAIQAAARALGYRPNRAASALATGRQHVIGGYIHNFGLATSGVGEQLYRGLAAKAARRQNRLNLRFFDSVEGFHRLLPEISPGALDGIVVGGNRIPALDAALLDIAATGVPVVTVYERPGAPFPNVFVDQRRVGRMATEHLVSRGCRRIAHIAVTEPRCEGYRQALQQHGLPDDPGLVYHAADHHCASGEAAARHLLAAGVAFDGLFAQSDELALGALHALLAAGRCVPRDVRIVGVDDSPLCHSAVVPLSSVSNRQYRQGAMAVDLLLRAIAGATVESQEVEPRLHERASTA